MHKKAFALAEVLITLALISIIAVLTIPNLMHKYERHVYESQIKKFYSTLANNIQIKMKEVDCQDIACTITANGITYGAYWNYPRMIQNLSLFFKEVKQEQNGECVPENIYSINGAQVNSITPGGRMNFCVNNGIGISLHDTSFNTFYGYDCSSETTQCIQMVIFLDGAKKKAVLGKNTFGLMFLGNGTLSKPRAHSSIITKDMVINGTGSYGYEHGRYPLYYLMQHGWQMDYLE